MARKLCLLLVIAVLVCTLKVGGLPVSSEEDSNEGLLSEDETVQSYLELLELDYDDQCQAAANITWDAILYKKKVNYPEQVRALTKFASFQRAEARKIRRTFENTIGGNEKAKRSYDLFAVTGDSLTPHEKYKKFADFVTMSQRQYSSATVCDTKKSSNCELLLKDVQWILARSRNEVEIVNVWKQWMEMLGSNSRDYLSSLNVVSDAAEANGFPSTEKYWTAMSEYSGEYKEILKLWEEIRPMYQKFHNFVSRRIHAHYKTSVRINGSIPVHLLGDFVASDWSGVADMVMLDPKLRRKPQMAYNENAEAMYGAAEATVSALAGTRLPDAFWVNLNLKNTCPPTVINFCKNKDIRISSCEMVSWKHFLDAHEAMMRTTHHILAASHQPYAFRDSNRYSAAYEAVSGLAALALTTPSQLKDLGLYPGADSESVAMTTLLLTALHTLPRLPYYLAADLWRLGILSGSISERSANEAWWSERERLQGVRKMKGAGEDWTMLLDMDILLNRPCVGKFMGIILQFQMLEHFLKDESVDDLHKSDLVYAVSSKSELRDLMSKGMSLPWEQLLKQEMQILHLDAGPLVRYFRPLMNYIDRHPAEDDNVDVPPTAIVPEKVSPQHRAPPEKTPSHRAPAEKTPSQRAPPAEKTQPETKAPKKEAEPKVEAKPKVVVAEEDDVKYESRVVTIEPPKEKIVHAGVTPARIFVFSLLGVIATLIVVVTFGGRQIKKAYQKLLNRKEDE